MYKKELPKEQILKRSVLDLIKLDLWFHILRFFSKKNIPSQRTFVKVERVLRENYGKKNYFYNMTRTKMSAFFCIPSQTNPSLNELKSSVHLLLQLLRKVTVMMHGNCCTPLCKWAFSYLKCLLWLVPQSSGTFWLIHNQHCHCGYA